MSVTSTKTMTIPRLRIPHSHLVVVFNSQFFLTYKKQNQYLSAVTQKLLKRYRKRFFLRITRRHKSSGNHQAGQ